MSNVDKIRSEALGMVRHLMHDHPLTLALHEEAHLFGFNHSRAVSQWPTNEYSDCYDVESAMSCVYTFAAGTTFGGSGTGTQKGPGRGGPGMCELLAMQFQGEAGTRGGLQHLFCFRHGEVSTIAKDIAKLRQAGSGHMWDQLPYDPLEKG